MARGCQEIVLDRDDLCLVRREEELMKSASWWRVVPRGWSFSSKNSDGISGRNRCPYRNRPFYMSSDRYQLYKTTIQLYRTLSNWSIITVLIRFSSWAYNFVIRLFCLKSKISLRPSDEFKTVYFWSVSEFLIQAFMACLFHPKLEYKVRFPYGWKDEIIYGVKCSLKQNKSSNERKRKDATIVL